MSEFRIIGLDPGSQSTGVCIVDGGHINTAFNVSNDQLFGKIQSFLIHPNCTIALEVIRPYSMRLTPQVILTCEFIGVVRKELKMASGCVVDITRNEVKKWVFDNFQEVCIPMVVKKMLKRGQDRKPSFVYVDDRVVVESMKALYGIEKPAPGAGFKYGLKDHSWQALVTATFLYYKIWSIPLPGLYGSKLAYPNPE